ncbi:MAG: hypothetical protein PHH30_00430 [Bacteroidales bacterium]|nr:hypothetical protein [Bacteroidales bacterium]
MKKLLLLCTIIIINISCFSQEKAQLYSGGMLFLQPGYTIAENQYQKIERLGFGIGGILRFYIKEQFFIGIVGGSQKTKYSSIGSDNSYISLGYGGPMIGYTYHKNKLRFCAGLSLGRGKLKNLHIQTQNGVNLTNADYYSYKAWVGYPMLSLDYMMSDKIAFTSQVIFLGAHYNKNDLYFCPVFQLGILFNR